MLDASSYEIEAKSKILLDLFWWPLIGIFKQESK